MVNTYSYLVKFPLLVESQPRVLIPCTHSSQIVRSACEEARHGVLALVALPRYQSDTLPW